MWLAICETVNLSLIESSIMDHPNTTPIQEVYRMNKRHFASGLYGSLYTAEHNITKEKRVVRVIPNFIVNRSKSFFAELEKIRAIVTLWQTP